ncbi:MAG: hypothetical protein JWM16_720 [Verrucomicrobiales bacterium]|nr:hypothetical protein [Verrucomicrobiales bacterium]
MKTLSVILGSFVFFGSLSLSVAADPKPVITNDKPAAPTKPAAAAKKQRPVPFSGSVVAVDKTAKTITIGKNKLRVFQITGETKINKDKKPATLDQIVVGEMVGGSYRENADGKLEIVTLNAGERGKASANEDSKEKKEKKKS